MKQTGKTKPTEYDGRLAELAVGWFRQAKELDVALQYEFTGITMSPGREGMPEAVDNLVTRAIRFIGALPEQKDRWLTLTVDRQPDGSRLICAAGGPCPVEADPLAELGAQVEVSQLPDLFKLTVLWSPRAEAAGTSLLPAGSI